MRGICDRGHLVIGEMRAQTAALLAQHAAGRGNLDDVGAVAAGLAHFGGALDRAGAGEAAGQQIVDLRQEAGHIAMPADDRERRPGGNDARAGNQAFIGAPAQRERGLPGGARLPHGGEAGLHGFQRIFHAHDHAPFARFGRFLPEIAARIAGQMHMCVDQAGQHGLVAEVDDVVAGGRSVDPGGDRDDFAVLDQHRGRTHGVGRGIGDQIADKDRLGGSRTGKSQQGQGEQQRFHLIILLGRSANHRTPILAAMIARPWPFRMPGGPAPGKTCQRGRARGRSGRS